VGIINAKNGDFLIFFYGTHHEAKG